MGRQNLIRLGNALAFLLLFTEDWNGLFKKSPDYILEKYMRYTGKYRIRDEDNIEYMWGLHPLLGRLLRIYFEKWNLEFIKPDGWDDGLSDEEKL